jgi:cell division protein FtsL
MSAARTGAARAQPRKHAPTGSRSARTTRADKGRSTTSQAGAARNRRHKPQHRPRLRVAPPPRRRWLPFLIVSFLIVGVLVVGVTSLQAVVSQGSFRMQELTRHNRQLQQEYGRLKLKVAQLSSPGRIARQARRLGFHLPDPGEVRALPVKGGVPPNETGGLRRTSFSLKGVLEERP